MDHDPAPRGRRSLRLTGYDYTKAGAYFVTVVTQDRLCLFGTVADGEVRLNEAGRLVRTAWESLPGRFAGLALDAFVVMPNHIHGVIVIDRPVGAGGYALGDVIRTYKSLTTAEYARHVRADGWPSFNDRLWQRNYYEHVVRRDEDMDRIRAYIRDNPLKWELDSENLAPARKEPTL